MTVYRPDHGGPIVMTEDPPGSGRFRLSPRPSEYVHREGAQQRRITQVSTWPTMCEPHVTDEAHAWRVDVVWRGPGDRYAVQWMGEDWHQEDLTWIAYPRGREREETQYPYDVAVAMAERLANLNAIDGKTFAQWRLWKAEYALREANGEPLPGRHEVF